VLANKAVNELVELKVVDKAIDELVELEVANKAIDVLVNSLTAIGGHDRQL
jgi:hypothetical protein